MFRPCRWCEDGMHENCEDEEVRDDGRGVILCDCATKGHVAMPGLPPAISGWEEVAG